MEARVILSRVFPPIDDEEEYSLFSGYAIVPTEEGIRTVSCGIMLKYRPLTEAAGGTENIEGKPYQRLARSLSFGAEGNIVDDEFVVDEVVSSVRVCSPRKKRFDVTVE